VVYDGEVVRASEFEQVAGQAKAKVRKHA